MRSEQEMLDLIIGTARDDDRIRAVMLNGSRTNPNAPRDPFQDYDVVYVVTDVAPFAYNETWIDRFGERMMMQMPEAMGDPPPSGDGCFVYLMQFADGNRIDLTLYPLDQRDDFEDDSLSVVLLDKDGVFDRLPPASDRDYLPMPPTAKAFDDCCNEFWWVSAYVAKGLWREEILYAKRFQDHFVRPQLMKMITWYAGMQTGFTQSPGKCGKYLDRILEPDLWTRLLQTYSDADEARTWDALFTMGDLFREVALRVADRYGFDYPHNDDRRMTAHLRYVRDLPHDATEMYRSTKASQRDALIDNAIAWALRQRGSSDYKTLCLGFVRAAYELGNNLELESQGHSAKEAADTCGTRWTPEPPPRGAFVFYDCWGPVKGERRNWGHVGLSLGGGTIIHAWGEVQTDEYLAVQELEGGEWTKPRYIGWMPVSTILEGSTLHLAPVPRTEQNETSNESLKD